MVDELERVSYIYLIENLVNGKCYVGKSLQPQRRWQAHKLDAKTHHKSTISSAIKKYGEHSFRFSVLEALPSEKESYVRESWWISFLGSDRGGYNLDSGGLGGRVRSPQTRVKLSESTKRVWDKRRSLGLDLRQTPELVEQRASANRGQKRSPEVRAKFSAAQQRPEVRARKSEVHSGKTPSLATRALMSAAKKGRKRGPRSPETRAKISVAHIGKIVTPETRAKLKASRLLRGRRQAEALEKEILGVLQRSTSLSLTRVRDIVGKLRGRKYGPRTESVKAILTSLVAKNKVVLDCKGYRI